MTVNEIYALARLEYEEAKQLADVARKRECDALNALNAAQKAFDEVVQHMRDNAPWESDWRCR